jgi:orotidine-5'-phosphate decarboxylase
MSDLFADRLLDAIARKGPPICVGIDPIYEMIPDAIAGDARSRDANNLDACIDAIYAFTTKVLQIVAPLVPCVKFQSGYFEKYYSEGVAAYYELIGEAHDLGLIVIGDVKRGDIGSTSEAYAQAHLIPPPFAEVEDVAAPDAITVNPFLGLDTLEPFIKAAREFDRGLFVLIRTSNPGSGDFQDAKTDDGRTFSEMLADKLAPIAAGEGLIGVSGYSSIGAVVGATQSHTIASLRKRLPKSLFLLPGYGTQGATAEMTRAAFNEDGRGAIISASRSILYPKTAAPMAWEDAAAEAVRHMRADLQQLST